MDILDYEERFRAEPLDSAKSNVGINQVLGQFDRRGLVLWVNADVASALDSKHGELPPYSIEEGDTSANRSFSTQLHETIHYWQSIGSTSGLTHALGDATATFAVLSDLASAQVSKKPLIRSLVPADPQNPAYRIALCWNDLECACALLDTPISTAQKLQMHRGTFESVGQACFSLAANTAATLGDAFDPEYTGLLNPNDWLESFDRFTEERRSGFETGHMLDIPLGLREIMEGQARVSEIQHRNFTQTPLSWQDVRDRGWLSGIYGLAFDVFLKRAMLPEPEHPQDDSVNLFLLLCDVAMNPSTGLADPICEADQFVHNYHPGIRFLKLCKAVAEDTRILARCGDPSIATYHEVTRLVCEPFAWKTPTQVAELILERWSKAESGEQLATQQASRQYGPDDVHRRFLIGEHLDFLDTRKQIPHLFCWPAWSLVLLDGDGPDYAEQIQQAFGLHPPPFTCIEESGMNTVEISRLSQAEQPVLVANYFMTLALYDLCRQWIAKPGPFFWNRLRWKTTWTQSDVDALKTRFKSVFGIDAASIAI